MGGRDAESDRIQRLEEDVARFKLKEKKTAKAGQVAGHKTGPLTSRCPTCPDGTRVENALVRSLRNVMSVKNQGISKEHLLVRRRRRK